MPSTRNESQITWSSSNSVTVTSATPVASDAFAFDAEDWEADLHVYADNQGTPAAGDTADFYIAYTSGDILGDSGDDYATTEHAEFLCRLDTYATNTPGEDPAGRIVPLRTAGKGFKVIAVCAQAATRNVVVRARVITHRPQ